MNKLQTPNSKLVLVTLVINFLLLAGCGMGGNPAVPEKSKDKTITEVIINTSPKVTATVDVANRTVTAIVPAGTDLSTITLEISYSSGASITPDPKIAQDFSNGKTVKYTVTAENKSTQVYAVSISVAKQLGTTKTITKASIINPKKEMTIDDATKKITATVPFGTDLTAITLSIKHNGASIAPDLATPQDFSVGKSVTYTVKAEDGSSQAYTVSIKKLNNTKTITKASIVNPKTEMTINDATKKITATVPFGTDLTAIILNITHNGVFIYPDDQIPQDFTNGKTVLYRVKAEDDSEEVYEVIISVAQKQNSDKTITEVIVNTSPKVTAIIDGTKITTSVPPGTDLTAITLSIKHNGASIAPDPKTSQDFSNGKTVTYTVKAKDDSEQTYTVRIKEQSNMKTIVNIGITYPAVKASRVEQIYSETFVLSGIPYGTNLTTVTLAIDHNGVSIAPDPETPQDFSNGRKVKYTVTAENGSTQNYYIGIDLEAPKQGKSITEVTVNTSPKLTANIDEANKSITASVPFGTNLTAITLDITYSDGASISPEGNIPQDFSNGKTVPYTVTAENGTEQIYTVSLTAKKPSSDKSITKASIISPVTKMNIDDVTKKITAALPGGTNLTAISLNITYSNGASIFPLPETAQDFSDGKEVTYTVTAQDGSTQLYKVSISLVTNEKIEITDVHIGFHAYYGQVKVVGKDLKDVAIVVSTLPTPKALSLISTEAKLIRDLANNVSRPIAITWDDTFKNEYLYELTNTSKLRGDVSTIKANDDYASERVNWVLKQNTAYYVHVYYNGNKTFTHSFNTPTYPTSLSEAKTKYNWEERKAFKSSNIPENIEYSTSNPLLLTHGTLYSNTSSFGTTRIKRNGSVVLGLEITISTPKKFIIRFSDNPTLNGYPDVSGFSILDVTHIANKVEFLGKDNTVTSFSIWYEIGDINDTVKINYKVVDK